MMSEYDGAWTPPAGPNLLNGTADEIPWRDPDIIGGGEYFPLREFDDPVDYSWVPAVDQPEESTSPPEHADAARDRSPAGPPWENVKPDRAEAVPARDATADEVALGDADHRDAEPVGEADSGPHTPATESGEDTTQLTSDKKANSAVGRDRGPDVADETRNQYLPTESADSDEPPASGAHEPNGTRGHDPDNDAVSDAPEPTTTWRGNGGEADRELGHDNSAVDGDFALNSDFDPDRYSDPDHASSAPRVPRADGDFGSDHDFDPDEDSADDFDPDWDLKPPLDRDPTDSNERHEEEPGAVERRRGVVPGLLGDMLRGEAAGAWRDPDVPSDDVPARPSPPAVEPPLPEYAGAGWDQPSGNWEQWLDQAPRVETVPPVPSQPRLRGRAEEDETVPEVETEIRVPAIVDRTGGNPGMALRRPRPAAATREHSGGNRFVGVLVAVGIVVALAAVVMIAVNGSDGEKRPTAAAPSAVPVAPKTTAATPTEGEPAVIATPDCVQRRTPEIVSGTDAGGTTDGPSAILAFERAYYVQRSGYAARAVVAEDSSVPAAEQIQRGINRIPVGTLYCVEITRAEGADASRWRVRLTQQVPGAEPTTFTQVITTVTTANRTVITAIAAG
ncbi:hypothetical protein ACWEKT_14690 [Nocardia takedensis]